MRYVVALCLVVPAISSAPQPDVRTYKTIGTIALKAHIFMPVAAKGKLCPAIILLHGGGWTTGQPEWTYEDAARFAKLGMVAISGEYRLSDRKNTTPLEAMADARDLIRWVRRNATSLTIDPHRIAAYGVSAGGHLATAAAVFPHNGEDEISPVPDALILISPPVSLVGDRWPQLLLGKHGEARNISPVENIRGRLPPTIVIGGAADTVAPATGATAFCERAHQYGGACELHLFPGLGHILSRNLDPHAQEEGPFDPDPFAVEDAHAQESAFLRQIRFVQ